jgi:hemerythrin-like domain-containing protein
MRRSAALTPLSHDHHHALDVARRLRRATLADQEDVLADLREFWADEGQRHFELEERHLVTALADPEWRLQIERMLHEHRVIRATVATAAGVDTAHELGTLLHDHVRFEERVLFPLLESRLSGPRLAALGAALAHEH